MPLTDHPHLKPSTGTVENELAVGESTRRSLEYNQTISQPGTVTINMLANAYNSSLFIWLLLQSGCSEADAAINTLTGIPYTSPDPEIYAAVTRILGGTAGNADAVSQYMVGCICNSLTFSGETGGILTLSAEIMAADHAIAANNLGTVSWSALTFSDKAPLKFQDMSFELGTQAVDTPSFSITITNGATAQFYNNGTIQRYVLGRINVEGTFSVPFGDANEGGNAQIQDFKDGVDMTAEFFWGSDDATTENSLAIQSNIRFTDTEMADAEGEIITSCPFAGVNDGTNAAVGLLAGYTSNDLDRNIP